MNRSVSATYFKGNCLRLLDEVAQTGEVLVVTKHNKPVARVLPAEGPGRCAAVGSSWSVMMS